LNNAGKSEKPIAASSLPIDDIPVALRDDVPASPKVRTNKFALFLGLTAIALAALGAGSLVSLQLRQVQNVTLPREPSPAQTSPTAVASPVPSASPATLLGHFPYTEAPHSELAPVASDGSILLRKAAAERFRDMVAAAEQSGVILVPLSGFRSKTDQDYLFFNIKAERGQAASERAKVSAPPGYSEHHTGYAIDIGDGSVPATNLSPIFENTQAFRWLQANAAFYSFELSFPKGNRQGVTYEPWHWRFVGDRTSLETFYKARTANNR
jgi:D-alanyl-D-alanine carboxypeptidase